ncbi:myosin-VIIa-like isoform X2 [Rhodnius prolixus]
MSGACIQHYLLEKSRIKSQNWGDRNYHIFYSMLAGLSNSEKQFLHLKNPEEYFYLKQGRQLHCPGRDESVEFLQLKDALITLKFGAQETEDMFKALASILHIGNLRYTESVKENEDACDVQHDDHLKMINELLGFEKSLLIETLTKRTIIVLGNKVVSHITKSQALSKRDAFAMSLYSRIFTYVLIKINKSISDHHTSRTVSTGILDIFGFENFTINSFEQLCINFANEHLQQFFVQQVFKIEQEEYKNEGIDWHNLEYKDNQSVLNLLGTKQGVLMLIDEQSRFPKGSDEGYLVNVNQYYSDHDYYFQSKSEVSRSFGIKHYAGKVIYSTEGIVEKNMNTLSSDWLDLIRNSNSLFLKNIFSKYLLVNSKSNSPTLVAQYMVSMESLMATLNACEPVFIRCIKPNHNKSPKDFHHALVCQQLRYLGIMETALIRQSGYPIRHTYIHFILRYRLLLPGCPPLSKIPDPKSATKIICEKLLKNNEYRLGKTKIFLKIPDELLELYRENILTRSAIIIQKNIRCYIFRKRFMKMKKAAHTVQLFWRGYKPRSLYRQIRQGYLRLQACIRSRQLRCTYLLIKLCVIRLQARCRGLLLRKQIKLANMSPVLLVPPIAVQRNISISEEGLENWITKVFELAVDDQCTTPTAKEANSSAINVNEILHSKDVISFPKFAATNFTGNVSYRHSTKKLHQPLLELSSPGDQLAATAVWVTILRFMEDLDESQKQVNITTKKQPIMSQLCKTISKSYINSKQYIDAYKAFKEGEERASKNTLEVGPSKLVHLTLAHRTKLLSEIKRGQLEAESLAASYKDWLNNVESDLLDKLHFIIGHGILRPTLRDEIYCQLCKQLSRNPSKVSELYGWLLMTLCASCFAPTPKFAPTLLHFMAENGNKLDCIMRLQRTLLCGTRNDPPTAFELNALKVLKPITLKIHLVDGSTVSMNADAATTANEVCRKVAERINLAEKFGFSLFISMFGKCLSLESGGCHVMDGISHCEALAKERGLPEGDDVWTLLFRKEMFSPWQSFIFDPIATNLVYNQIIYGSSLGDYRCSKDIELSLLVAQHYYVTCGKILLPEILTNLIKEVVPISLVQKQGIVYWVKLVTDTFNKSYFLKCDLLEEEVKQDVVEFAKRKWALLFSKYYEVNQIAGISFGVTPLLMAINSDGIYFVKNTTEILMKIYYVEIAAIEYSSIGDDKDQIHILTIHNSKFVFQTTYAEVINHLINWILKELRGRSRYALAINNYSSPDENFLSLHKGDLVILEEVFSMSSEWLKGFNSNTNSLGEFPSKMVIVLPTLNMPAQFVLDALKNEVSDKNLTKKSLLVGKHTLETYAMKYFRAVSRAPVGSKREKRPELWQFSKNLLWQPLHKDLSPHLQGATSMFTAILNYSGDRSFSGQIPHTRTIFDPPLVQEALRDELYCQLMKQLTENPNQSSENRIWELMWLATGLFSCSSILMQDLKLFLVTRPTKISQECLRRLEKIYHKGNRRLSHHWFEVESVQNGGPVIHNVLFPNGMSHFFYIESFTNVDELIFTIGDWLGLKNVEGFSLMISSENNAIVLPSQDYVFDAILEACNFPFSTTGTETPRYNYELHFVKKLWINTYAGVDTIADLVCHFYQELPKYMTGVHNCSIDDAIYIGALLFIAEYDRKQIIQPENEILKQLQHIVPEHLIDQLGAREWLDCIYKAYKQIKGMSSEDAKINFLKVAQRWHTFGSAFFTVHKSSTLQDEHKTLAVNRNGIYLLNPHTHAIELYHSYKEIISCSCTNHTISLIVTNAAYSWSTKAAYKISDFVNSYVDAYDKIVTQYPNCTKM